MNKAEKFLRKSIAISSILFLILLFFYVFSGISEIIFISVLIGGLLALCNFILGLTSIKIGLNRSQDTFFKVVLGGMVFRLLLLLGLVFISLQFLNINENSFIFSILFFYILYLIIEVIYLYMKKK
jgi:hypothetical protein